MSVLKSIKIVCAVIMMSLCSIQGFAQEIQKSTVGLGWSNNSVNAVVFRGKALTTYKDIQFTAYYNLEGKLVLAKRNLGDAQWQVQTTQYSGNVSDAHNSISIIVDNEGYVHVSWDQHNTKLRYAKSIKPFGLELSEELTMTGKQEERVTYPEFHKLSNGKLLFCYRSGESGRGNMVINEYNVATQQWTQLQNNLLDGEEQRSAYWQMTVGKNNTVYISWVWRETWDVSTNHDLCFAMSEDGGRTWKNSEGKAYTLPINAASAEVAFKIPQNSSLINQTSMTVDKKGNPYIATYWNSDSIPQYKIVYKRKGKWRLKETHFHKETFSLGGGGTKSIPIARPKVLVDNKTIYLLFRDEERNNKITLAASKICKDRWALTDVSESGVGQWEPNYDDSLWKSTKQLHIFSQKVIQVDGEGLQETTPQPVEIIEVSL